MVLGILSKIWGSEDSFEDDDIALELTDEQRKTYRKQYVKTMLIGLMFSFVFIIAILQIIDIMFVIKDTFFIGIVILILSIEKYVEILIDIKDEIELIKQRIEKRIKKNKKVKELLIVTGKLQSQ